MKYKVKNKLGTKVYRRENDAYDYAIRIIRQTGIKSTITREK